MFRNVPCVWLICAVLANQAMAVACHSHGEPSEAASRPHVHLNGHEHHHGHPHDRDHHHDRGNDESKNEDSATDPPSHDSDAIFFGESDSILSAKSRLIESPRFANSLTPLNWFSHRVSSDAGLSSQMDRRVPLAHALVLKKIRLLL